MVWLLILFLHQPLTDPNVKIYGSLAECERGRERVLGTFPNATCVEYRL